MSATKTLAFIFTLFFLALVLEAKPGKVGGKGRRPLLGGWQKMNKSSAEAQEAGRKATAHLEAVKNSMKAYRLHEILSAKYQIVSGTNYRLALWIAQTDCNRQSNVNIESCQAVKIQKCTVEIYVPLGSQPSQMTNFTCGKEKPVGKPARVKTTRRPVMPGGLQDIELPNEEANKAAVFAATELTTGSNGRYQVQHQRIIRGTTQVVAGLMYRLTIQVSVTFSPSNQVKTTQCEVKIWDQSWRTPRYILQEYSCNKHIA